MTSSPLVTIITPAYNRDKLLAETIESVLGQDYPNLEYIVLDDGSSDATLEVIRRYEDRLRWETHPNMGETRTVNRGFSLARGTIIGVVNSDDPLLPGAVSRLVACLSERPEVMVAYPDWQRIDGQGKVLQIVHTHDFVSAADMIRRHRCLPGPSAFFRREVAVKLGGRDARFRYVGDLDFWFRAAQLGPFRRVPEVLATFREHGGSATVSDQGTAMAEEHLQVLEKLYAQPDLPLAIRSVRDEAFSSAWYVAGSVHGKRAIVHKLGCFRRAVMLAPAKYAGEYLMRWPIMVTSLLGLSYLKVYYTLRRFADLFTVRGGR